MRKATSSLPPSRYLASGFNRCGLMRKFWRRRPSRSWTRTGRILTRRKLNQIENHRPSHFPTSSRPSSTLTTDRLTGRPTSTSSRTSSGWVLTGRFLELRTGRRTFSKIYLEILVSQARSPSTSRISSEVLAMGSPYSTCLAA